MRILVHVNKFYDWERLPAEIQPTQRDIKALRVKPAQDYGWLVRVPRDADTETLILVPESDLIEQMFQSKIKDGIFVSRAQAVCLHLSKNVMKHHAHQNWMEEFHVQDDGPVPDEFERRFTQLEAAGLVEDEDKAFFEQKYFAPADAEAIADALFTHFDVDPDAVEDKRAARAARANPKPSKE